MNEKAKTYELQVEIPLFGVKAIDQFFDEEAEQRIEHFIALLEHSGNVSPSHQGAYFVTTDLYKSGEEFFSVVMAEETYTGGANFDQKIFRLFGRPVNQRILWIRLIYLISHLKHKTSSLS